MIDGISESVKLNAVLSNYDDHAMNKLYSDVFTTEKGKLVVQDLANRCCMSTPVTSTQDEGARRVVLSIQTRLSNSITERKEIT